ncbi:unnamed protein product, partial [marine sediment metagenome]
VTLPVTIESTPSIFPIFTAVEGEVILDPKTNEVLDRELDLIAQARIMTVKEKLSIALVTTKFSNADIMPTDIVEVIR